MKIIPKLIKRERKKKNQKGNRKTRTEIIKKKIVLPGTVRTYVYLN